MININKKSKGSVVILIICVVLLILTLMVVVFSSALSGYLTGDNAKKISNTDDTTSTAGGMCTQTLEGHSLAEVGIINNQAKISSFGSNKVDKSLPCYDSGDNGNSAFGGVRPTGCDLNNSAHYYAAVCPAGGSPCKNVPWWHNKHLLITYKGKSVDVYIDDTGPNPNTGRQLDLSYAAIAKLGAPTDATVEVCLSDGSAVGATCGSIIPAAQSYLNKGIGYWKEDSGSHCGPDTIGPTGVNKVDCSGYITRIYRDVGLFSKGTCEYTVSLAQTSKLKRIATTVAEAKLVMKPGDIILFGLGNPSGSPTKGDNSHAVLYGGKSGSQDIVYESGGRRGGGPKKSIYNVFGSRQLYGVYRATQTCKALGS